MLKLAMLGFEGSARGQLRARARELRQQEKSLQRAAKNMASARKRFERLKAKVESVKPRVLQEAEGRAADAAAMHKIASDQVMIARNLVRKIIVEEYPPKRHARLRNRFIPEEQRDRKPFTMQS